MSAVWERDWDWDWDWHNPVFSESIPNTLIVIRDNTRKWDNTKTQAQAHTKPFLEKSGFRKRRVLEEYIIKRYGDVAAGVVE